MVDLSVGIEGFNHPFQHSKVADSDEQHDTPQKEIDGRDDGDVATKPDESTTEKPPLEDDGKGKQVEGDTDGGDKLLDL